MRVLLDTNIIIHREGHKTSNYSVARLYKWLDKLGCIKIVHPYTKMEILKYNDEQVRKSFDVKLESYQELTVDNKISEEFINVLKDFKDNENSQIDNHMLYQVYVGRVDIFITEDKGIHQKATLLGIKSKVFNTNTFISWATSEYPDLLDYKVLAIKQMKFGDINLSDHFFDTFRDDYINFDKWFLSKCDELAYVCNFSDEINGFLYIKTEYPNENYINISPQFAPKKRLKIGTFKVESTGIRVGERFLKIIFDNAKIQNVDEIYVTIFNHRESLIGLISLLERWGFVLFGEKTSPSGIEKVYIKNMKMYNKSVSSKQNFPLINNDANKFLLPIYPKYHTQLFPDSILNNEDMELTLTNSAHQYALQKVYITAAPTNNINSSDIALIYRIGEPGTIKKYSSVVSTIAIIDEILYPKTKEKFIEECNNRSVFCKSELEQLWNKNYRCIVKLLYYKSLNKRLILDSLYDLGVVNPPSGPRPFHQLTNEQFYTILSKSNTVL